MAFSPCERRNEFAGETFTSSDRVLRSQSRAKFVEVQATDAKSTTESAIGSVRRSARIEANLKLKRNQNS